MKSICQCEVAQRKLLRIWFKYAGQGSLQSRKPRKDKIKVAFAGFGVGSLGQLLTDMEQLC